MLGSMRARLWSCVRAACALVSSSATKLTSQFLLPAPPEGQAANCMRNIYIITRARRKRQTYEAGGPLHAEVEADATAIDLMRHDSLDSWKPPHHAARCCTYCPSDEKWQASKQGLR